MRLATIRVSGLDTAGIVTGDRILPIGCLNAHKGTDWAGDILGLIRSGQLEALTEWYNNGGKDELADIPGSVAYADAEFAAVTEDPKRIAGVLMNFAPNREEAEKLAARKLPYIFYKPAGITVGHKAEVLLPADPEFQGFNGESEMGIIIGKDCDEVDEDDWQSVVAGYTCTFDMNESSCMMGNDLIDGDWRHLSILKSFRTFFVTGPTFITADEVPDPLGLEIQCWKNGELVGKNIIDNMLFRPGPVISLLAHVHGLSAGDIITMGTPKPYPIKGGDVIKCVVTDNKGLEFETLECPVRQL